MKRFFTVPLFALVLVLTGCPTSSLPPTTPTPTPTPGTATLTGTWSGTTTTPLYGTQQTTFTLTQSGTQVSGTLTTVRSTGSNRDTPATGSVTGTSAVVSGTYSVNETATLEYRYEGTFSATTFSGTVTILTDAVAQQPGQFSVTKGGTTPTLQRRALSVVD